MKITYRNVTRIVAASGKIADLTHADVLEHSIALPTGYPADARSIIVDAERVAGTGLLNLISTSGDPRFWRISATSYRNGVWVRAVDGRFYYNLTVAGDDFDVFALGYITGAP